MTNLASVTQSQLDQWELRRDGEPSHGSGSMVLPVRTSDGTPAVLKISFPDAASEHEHLVLRRWGGNGAVRMLSADPPRHAILLERLHAQSLSTLSDVDACEVVADLYRRLHVPALPQLRTLTSYLEQWTRDFEVLPRGAPIPHRLVEQAVSLGRELADVPARQRRPRQSPLRKRARRRPRTVAGDCPQPVNGDPHYELAPMLWNRWDELSGHFRDGVRRRFYTLVDAAGFDEERARAWVVVRVMQEATRELANPTLLTKYVALAKAVQG